MATSSDDVVVRLRLADVQRFIADVKRGKLAIDDLEKQVKKVGATGKKESAEYGGLGLWGATVGRIKYAVAGLALAAGSGAVAIGAFAVKATAQLEQVKVGMTTLLGSTGAADAMVKKLQDFAKVTPFQMSDLEKQTQMLLAFGMASDSVIPSLTAIGDAVSAFGGSAADLDSVILAMGQIATKGHLSYDELRQLNEHKINAVPWLEQALGVSGPELQKMIEAKKLSSSKAIPIILKGMENSYRGAMDAQSKTLAGIWSNVIDEATTQTTNRMQPFLPMMKSWLSDFRSHIPEIAGVIGGILTGAFTLAQKTGTFVANVTGQISTGNSVGAGRTAGKAVPGLLESLLGDDDMYGTGVNAGKKSIGFLWGFAEGIFDLPTWGRIVKKHWWGMLSTILLVASGGVGGVGEKVGAQLAKLPIIGRILGPLFTTWGKAGSRILKPFTALGKEVGKAVERVFPEAAVKIWYFFARIGEFFKGKPGQVKSWAAGMGRSFLDAVVRGVGWAAGKVGDALTWVFRPVRIFFGTNLALILAKGWEQAKEGFSKVKDFITRGLISIANAFVDMLNGILTVNVAGHSVGPAIGHIQTPGMALGGQVTSAGASWVGERGPELMNVPKGATVIPLPRLPDLAGVSGRPIHVSVQVDRKEIARAVYSGSDDMAARL